MPPPRGLRPLLDPAHPARGAALSLLGELLADLRGHRGLPAALPDPEQHGIETPYAMATISSTTPILNTTVCTTPVSDGMSTIEIIASTASVSRWNSTDSSRFSDRAVSLFWKTSSRNGSPLRNRSCPTPTVISTPMITSAM